MKKKIVGYFFVGLLAALLIACVAMLGIDLFTSHHNDEGMKCFEQKDYDGTIKHLSLIWNKNDKPKVLYTLGCAYEAKKDYSKAEEFYSKAVELGMKKHASYEDSCGLAAMNLANLYYSGLIGKTPNGPDFARSLEYFKKSFVFSTYSREKQSEILCRIGDMYRERPGTNKNSDYNMAEKYYLLSLKCDNGGEQAKNTKEHLTEIYLQRNDKNGKPDYLKIANLYSGWGKEEIHQKYLKLAMTENNSAEAAYLLGRKIDNSLDSRKFSSEMIKLYRFAMERGSVDGAMALAEYYKNQRNYEASAEYYLKAVIAGNAKAMYQMAMLYRMGYKRLKNGSVDHAQVQKYIQTSSEHENGFATFMLGLAQEYGSLDLAMTLWYKNEYDRVKERINMMERTFGIKKQGETAETKPVELKIEKKKDHESLKKAVELYQKAISQGSEHAKMALAMLYWNGDYGRLQNNNPDYAKAIELFKSGNNGCTEEQYKFPNDAISFFLNYKTETNFASDMSGWILENSNKLEKSNDGTVFFELGYLYCKKSENNNDDSIRQKGLDYYRKAIDLKNEKAVVYYGYLTYPKENFQKEGLEYFKKAMMDGYSNAVHGYIYYSHKSCKNDPFVMLHLKKLADRNDTDTLVQLAKYADNYEEKIKYYQKAAEHGNYSALLSLADIYLKPEDGKCPDYPKALVCLKKIIADEEFNSYKSYAYARLGRMYTNGWGVEKNDEAAWDYYLKAGSNYVIDIISFLDELEKSGK